MTWEAIEYRLAGSDPLVCVQWDGLIGRWRVCETTVAESSDKTFKTLEEAKVYALTIAVPETVSPSS